MDWIHLAEEGLIVTESIYNLYIEAYLLKARTVEPEKQPLLANCFEAAFVSRQRLGKHAAVDTHATIEVLFEAVLSTRSVQTGYRDDGATESVLLNPCGGGVGNLHREPACRRRLRNGESHGTRTRKRLRWRGPAAIVNDRPVLSSERAPHINKPATV
jgi:hypothetical protein